MAKRRFGMLGLRSGISDHIPLVLLAGTVVAAGAAYVQFPTLTAITSTSIDMVVAPGKSAERLNPTLDADEAVRSVRIADTLAMFALPQADARTWTERPAPMAKTGDAPAREASVKERASKIRSATPRMVVSDAEIGRRTISSTTNRAPSSGQPAAFQDVGETGSRSANRTADASESVASVRTPIEVFGVALPGTQYLPGRREARKVVQTVGYGATTLGTKTADLVTTTASGVGGTLSSLGKGAAETLGWR